MVILMSISKNPEECKLGQSFRKHLQTFKNQGNVKASLAGRLAVMCPVDHTNTSQNQPQSNASPSVVVLGTKQKAKTLAHK